MLFNMKETLVRTNFMGLENIFSHQILTFKVILRKVFGRDLANSFIKMILQKMNNFTVGS